MLEARRQEGHSIMHARPRQNSPRTADERVHSAIDAKRNTRRVRAQVRSSPQEAREINYRSKGHVHPSA